MSDAAEAFFLAMPGRGQRFALHHRPYNSIAHGAVVYVHPMAEEMNKSRRMAALQARAFARAGYAVLQIDLRGCGDSSGDFGDASWEDWISDVVVAAQWMRERYAAPVTLWGLRAGCLIAFEAAQHIDGIAGYVLWQPATSGEFVLQQFLRLRLANEMRGMTRKTTMTSLRAQLAAGEPVDVAGYNVSPALAVGLERATLTSRAISDRIAWLELSRREDATLLPASAAAVMGLQHTGCFVRTVVVSGPSFWQTAEIEEAPALIGATLAAATVLRDG